MPKPKSYRLTKRFKLLIKNKPKPKTLAILGVTYLVGIISPFIVAKLLFQQKNSRPTSQASQTNTAQNQNSTPAPTTRPNPISIPPYQKLEIQDGQIKYQNQIIASDLDKSITSAIVGPDGHTIHTSSDQQDPNHWGAFTKETCNNKEPNPTCNGALLDEPQYLVSHQIDSVTNKNHITTESIYLEIKTPTDIKRIETSRQQIDLVSSDRHPLNPNPGPYHHKSSQNPNITYRYPENISLNPHTNTLLVLFGGQVIAIDLNNSTILGADYIFGESPFDFVKILYHHPTQPMTILATSWESAESARMILSYQNELKTFKVPLKLEFSIESTSEWTRQSNEDLQSVFNWYGDSTWTNQGIEFNVYNTNDIFGYETAQSICSFEFNPHEHLEPKNSDRVNQLDRDQEAKYQDQYQDVSCNICSEGPSSGFGCKGLISTDTYQFNIGDIIPTKLN